MRRLILKMSTSLDGFVAGPHGEKDWMFRSQDDAGRRWVEDTLWQAGLHVMGRRTYGEIATFWATANHPLAAPMNAIPKAVFTRQPSLDLQSLRAPGPETPTPEQAANLAGWADAGIVTGDLAAEINRLKQQPGKDILAHGGVDFAQSLVAAGLVDEYRLMVHPVVLGRGLSIFAKLPKPLDLELRSTTVFRSGATAQVYFPV